MLGDPDVDGPVAAGRAFSWIGRAPPRAAQSGARITKDDAADNHGGRRPGAKIDMSLGVSGCAGRLRMGRACGRKGHTMRDDPSNAALVARGGEGDQAAVFGGVA